MTPEPSLPLRRVAILNPRRAGRLAWLSVLLVLPGALILDRFMGMFGVIAALLGALVALVRATQHASPTVRAGELRLDAEGLSIGTPGQSAYLTLPKDEIVDGYETIDDHTVVLRLRSGQVLTLVLERDEPARVLAHAGVGIDQRALKLPLRGTLGAFTIGFMAFWPLVFAASAIVSPFLRGSFGWSFLLSLAIASAATALVVRRFGYPTVVIGADGIRVLGSFRRRFFSYDSIAGVAHQSGMGIKLRLRNGNTLTLPTIAEPRERVIGLARRLTKAWELHARQGNPRLAALARGERSLAAWKEDIERIAIAPPGFRDRATGPEEFERILGDAGAPADQRLGAALALRIVDPKTAAPRIRVAAEASADEELRRALTSAAEGEVDEALDLTARRRS